MTNEEMEALFEMSKKTKDDLLLGLQKAKESLEKLQEVLPQKPEETDKVEQTFDVHHPDLTAHKEERVESTQTPEEVLTKLLSPEVKEQFVKNFQAIKKTLDNIENKMEEPISEDIKNGFPFHRPAGEKTLTPGAAEDLKVYLMDLRYIRDTVCEIYVHENMSEEDLKTCRILSDKIERLMFEAIKSNIDS